MRTLSQILIDANAFLDLEASLPTGDELTLRSNYADQAVWDAAATGQLKEFKMIFEQSVSEATLATLSLPGYFKEFQTQPRIYNNGVWEEYPEIKPEAKYSKGADEHYSYVLGTPQGYNLILNRPIDGLFSSVVQRYPSGLPTLTSVCELPDPTYVTSTIESYVLQSRGDDRFPFVNSTAQNKLANMMGAQMKTPGGGVNSTPRIQKNPLG